METTDYCDYKLSLALKACGFNELCDSYYCATKYKKKSQLPSRRKHPRRHKIYMAAINREPTIDLIKVDDSISNKELASPNYPSFSWRDECIMPHYEYAAAVSLWQAQKWLREKWDLHIDVYPIADCSLDADGQVCEEWNYWTFDIMHVISTQKVVEDEERYGSYEEALSAGLSVALELIKKVE